MHISQIEVDLELEWDSQSPVYLVIPIARAHSAFVQEGSIGFEEILGP